MSSYRQKSCASPSPLRPFLVTGSATTSRTCRAHASGAAPRTPFVLSSSSPQSSQRRCQIVPCYRFSRPNCYPICNAYLFQIPFSSAGCRQSVGQGADSISHSDRLNDRKSNSRVNKIRVPDLLCLPVFGRRVD